ncbi:MAG: hypothetical protein WC867_03475 [Candidatus Pacearchaeota archaeon]|jgi:hypothetical protein
MDARTYNINIDLTKFKDYSPLIVIPVSILPSRCNIEGCNNPIDGYRCKQNELEKRAVCSNSPIAKIYEFLDSRSAAYTPFNHNGQGNIIAFLRLDEVKKLSSSGLIKDIIPIEDSCIHGIIIERK